MKRIFIFLLVLPFFIKAQTTTPIIWTGLNSMLYNSSTNTLINNNNDISNWTSSANGSIGIITAGHTGVVGNISLTQNDLTQQTFFGLANAPIGTANSNYTHINYGYIFVAPNWGIYENGVYQAGGTLTAGHVFKIQTTDLAVSYYIDNVLQRTSSTAPTFPLIPVAAGLHSQTPQPTIVGATITNYQAVVPVNTGRSITLTIGGRPIVLSANGNTITLSSGDTTTVIPPDTTTHTTGFRFALDTSSITSAGIYDVNDNLVRTLWSGIRYSAGNHDTIWDGRNDSSILVTNGTYTAKVTANNISADYLGVIGNNSDSIHGPTKWRANPITSMAFVNSTTCYNTVLSTEGTYPLLKFNISTPHQKTNVYAKTQYQTNGVSATDGTLVYVASASPHPTINNTYIFYIWAIDPSTDQPFAFANSVDVSGQGTVVHNAIDSVIAVGPTYSAYDINRVTSNVAVQRSGNLLFSGHPNYINVYNKTTGAFIIRDSIVGGRMVCDYSGNLWILNSGAGTIKKFSVSTGGVLSPLLTITTNSYPMALDISPDNSTIITIDGSTQQVKTYSNSTGAGGWVLGQLYGYNGNCIVSNDRFYFKDDKGDRQCSVTYQPDGSFWVNDIGNNRRLHYAADRTYLDFIMHQPSIYFASIDPANKTHAYMGFQRFTIDYSNPLKLGWVLDRNYEARRPITNTGFGQDYDRPPGYFTLGNGRTYTYVGENSHAIETQYEVMDTGFRKTGYTFTAGQAQMDSVGNILQLAYTGGSWTTYKYPIVGFDGNNNPQYGLQAIMEQIPSPLPTDPVYAGPVILGSKLSNGDFPFYDNTNGATYHLGILKHNGTAWSKRAMRPTFTGWDGDFPNNGYYDIGNQVINAGGTASVHNDIIYAGYHGENWKQSQTNKWNMFDKNALFLYQFGAVQKDIVEEAGKGMAGNTFYNSVVDVSGNTFLFQQDESFQAGLLYWKISNVNAIKTTTYTLAKNTTPIVTFPYVRLMEKLVRNNELAMNDSSGWIRNRAADPGNWNVYVGVKSSELNDLPDIYCIAGSIDTGRNVTKTIPIAVSNSSWTLQGQIGFDRNIPNTGSEYSGFEILDDNNMVIANITEKRNTTDGSKADLVMNGYNLGTFAQSNGTSFDILSRFAQFSMQNVGGLLTLAYNGQYVSTSTIVDAGALIARATKVRLKFTGSASTKAVAIYNITFVRN